MESPQRFLPRAALVWIGVFVAAVIAVGSYMLLNKMGSQSSYQGPKQKIAIGAGRGAFLVWIADNQGYFDDAGLDADVRLYKTGKAAAGGMSKGEVDVSTSASFVLVKKSFEEPDLRAIASIHRGYTIGFVARRDHGIEIPADLKGKRVGLTLGSASEYFLGRFLIFNSLELGDIELADMSPAVMVEAIANGEIDAAFTWEPHIYDIKGRIGDNATVFSGQGKQEFYFLLLAKDGWIQAHPSPVKRMLRALVRAKNLVRSNPEKSRAIIQNKFAYDPGYLDYYWTLLDHNVEMPQSLITLLEDQARWAINNNIVRSNEMPNYMDFLYLEGLDAVDPDAVTVIK